MFEYSIQLSPSEKLIISEALNNAQIASNLEKNNQEDKALIYYKKALQILELNIKNLSNEKQSIYQTMLESYKERISILQTFHRKNSFTSVDDTFLYTHKFLDNNTIPEIKKTDNNLIQNNKKINKTENNPEEFNLFMNFKLNNEENKGKTIEDALNIINELQKLELLIDIIEKTMISGGHLTKNIYVPAIIWKIEINDLVIEEIEKYKIKYFKIIADQLAILLYPKDLNQIKKESSFLKAALIKIYKEEKFQNILNVSKIKKTFFESYKDIFKKNFSKLNLYITSNTKQSNYIDVALDTLQSVKKLVGFFRTIEKKDEELGRNILFFYCFFKDVLLKILITDLELRLNQYLVLIRKKIIEK